MRTILLLLITIILASCNNINIIADKGKNPCYYDKKGAIKPYKADKYRVTETYLWENK